MPQDGWDYRNEKMADADWHFVVLKGRVVTCVSMRNDEVVKILRTEDRSVYLCFWESFFLTGAFWVLHRFCLVSFEPLPYY